MGDEHDLSAPEDGEVAEAPDLATLLTEAVRSAALRLPPDRVLPVVYVVDPLPERRSR
jgi:hypothetical protein